MPKHQAHSQHSQHPAHGAHHQGAPEPARRKLPFLWGTQEQRIPIASIPFSAGQKAATIRVPKNGYLSKLLFHFVGSGVTSGTVGAAGNPSIFNVIGNYVLSYNGGFQYRNLDGESMLVMNLARMQGPDVCQGGGNYANYNPHVNGTYPVSFIVEDDVNLNTQVNADKYLLAAQARNADITIDITFGTIASILANTETLALTGTLYIEGLYLLDPPSYAHFDEPNLKKVQQILTDTSYTNVTIGDNTVPIVPVNGPKYLQLFFKGVFNNVPDAQGAGSSISRVQLKINNGLNRYDMTSQALSQENMRQLQRIATGGTRADGTSFVTPTSLPPGWYMLDFLDDASINNAVSQVMRNVISTEKIANLWLIPTVAAGTTLTANNMFKLIKRVELPAVGGTNRTESAMQGG